MVTFPNAKINIGLNITERRPDGYHNIESVFYPVGISDALEVIESPQMKFTASGLPIPGDLQNNICLQAYSLMSQEHDLPPVHIHLHKHIPIGAGLGGGSSDAAFFIRLVSEKFNLGLTDGQMEAYCRQLGADCAFFVRNIPVFAFGRGDQFAQITLDLSDYFIVLVMPHVHVSTAEAYRGVNPVRPKNSLCDLITLPVGEWKYQIKNDFEGSVFKDHPAIGEMKKDLYDAGALYASMSGSGSAVYAIFEDAILLPHLEKQAAVFYGIQR